MKTVRCDDCNESFAAQQIFEIDGHKLCNKCLYGNRNDVSASVQQDWKNIADQLATTLRQCQVPADWPIAWPDGMSEGTPWVDEALAIYDAAYIDREVRS